MIVFVTNILLLIVFIYIRRYLNKQDKVKREEKNKIERTNNLLKNSKYKEGDKVFLLIPSIMHKSEKGRIRGLTIQNNEVLYFVDIYFNINGLPPVFDYWIPVDESCIKFDRKTRIRNLNVGN